ncbi:hypothetical protein ACHWQZ_G010375 [Mnemiopsis leidyi]
MKIKCFVSLHDGNSVSEEVRLFKVDPSSDTPFDDLSLKLFDCYRNNTCEFGLSWKDEEGDDIVVSSNGELQAALEECPGAPNSTLKLNVTALLHCQTEPVHEDDGIRVICDDNGEFVSVKLDTIHPEDSQVCGTQDDAASSPSTSDSLLTVTQTTQSVQAPPGSAKARHRGSPFSFNKTPFSLSLILSFFNCVGGHED